MKFEAKIEKDGVKLFEASGEKEIGEILAELDKAIKKEIGKKGC